MLTSSLGISLQSQCNKPLWLKPLQSTQMKRSSVPEKLFYILGCFYFLHVHADSTLDQQDFPPNFVFGAGTSAYQVEGAAEEDGRKPSVWDTFTHHENHLEVGTGDISSDQYHNYKEDVKLMHKMGLDAYRFSISWSRVIPDGHGVVNPLGLKYYNNLIDELTNNGIEAHVTLSHFDLPQALQDEYGGFLSLKFIEDFTAYADFCFTEFGDRVKHWMTFNEPNTEISFTTCFFPSHPTCSNGDLKSEIYLPAHHILLAHAAAVHLYRAKYQKTQKGNIGITLLGIWAEPLAKTLLDIDAAKEEMTYKLDWFLSPLVYGSYPAKMTKSLGTQLPNITKEESSQIKGSFDFIGLNHYYGVYVQGGNNQLTAGTGRTLLQDRILEQDGLSYKHLPLGIGLTKLLEYVKLKYKNPPIFIHENGYGEPGDKSLGLNDTERIEYLDVHIQNLLESMRNGSNVKGYFVWSFLDCFELFGGYRVHYGMYGVDFSDKNRTRHARLSAQWYSNTLLTKTGRTLEEHSYSAGRTSLDM